MTNCRGGTIRHVMADGRIIEDEEELAHYLDDHKLPPTTIQILKNMIQTKG